MTGKKYELKVREIEPGKFRVESEQLKRLRAKFGDKYEDENKYDTVGSYGGHRVCTVCAVLKASNVFLFGDLKIPVRHLMTYARTLDSDELVVLELNTDHIKLSTDYSKTIIKSQDTITIKKAFPVTFVDNCII